MTKKKTLLIDADYLAYSISASKEFAEEDKDGYWTWKCNLEEVTKGIEDYLDYLKMKLRADDHILCLTDTKNYRKDFYPAYKDLRQKLKRPVVLKEVRRWMIEDRGAYLWESLEGDDILGILATQESDDVRIIVSPDKDMKTIPGKFYTNNEMLSISKEEAQYWHYYQTLIGDTTDGYPGCKGIGPVAAEKALKKSCTWETVVSEFKKKGFSEEDALTQARCAYILHDGDYDHETKEVKLWTPPQQST